ncbi:MAG: hypothetical protein H6742_16425 [Alphaproteobacteria bacterium]|nr:hypothetical protein [Alphaproteobacteria bacterium]
MAERLSIAGMLPALLPAALLLPGCVSDHGTLAALQAAYGEETVGLAQDAVVSATLLGALAADACVGGGAAGWAGLFTGEPLPVDSALAAALGDPAILAIEADETGTTLSLAGLSAFGHDDLDAVLVLVGAAPLRLSLTTGDGSGTADLEVSAGCTAERAAVSGTVSAAGELAQTVTLPAPDDEGAGLSYPGAEPWLPGAGTLRWSAPVSGVSRAIVTADASEIDDGAGDATWPATAKGGETANEAGWEADVAIVLAP